MKIITAPHPILSKRSDASAVVSVNLLTDMFNVIRQHRALGLAAPQVGIDARVFVTHCGQVFINPMLNEYGGDSFINVEGCLSIPGKLFSVRRRERIKVNGIWYIGLTALVIQHELDHLNGMLISDTGYEVAK